MTLEQLSDNPFQLSISFHKVIEYWEQLAAEENGLRTELAKKVLQEIEPYPGLKNGITDFELIKDIPEVISHLLADLFPEALSLNEIKAVSVPYLDIIINPTKRLQNILDAANPPFDMHIRNFTDHRFYVMSCCLILNEFYGTNFDLSTPLFYDIPTASGIVKHYRILYNGDFIELMPTEKAPMLSPADVQLLMDNFDNFDLWREKFPPQSWILKGFGMMIMYDATIENAVSTLKETFLGAKPGVNLKEQLASIFQSIYRVPDLRIGFTSFDNEESKFTLAGFNQKIHSYLLNDEPEMDASTAMCGSGVAKLVKKKMYYAVSDVDRFLAENNGNSFASHFKSQNIKSFILAPVVKNNILLGVFEVISYRPGELNSINANRLDVVMPFLTDTIDRQLTDIQNRVQALIQNEYTTIHPSVYWKFKREALKAIQFSYLGKDYALKEITFRNVFPLYGQIDIKGSSDTRNTSLQLDLQNQLTALFAILRRLQHGFQDLATIHIPELTLFAAGLVSALKADSEQFLYHYLDINIHPVLREALLSHPEMAAAIKDYFLQVDKTTGDFHLNRRKYDITITLINEKMALLLDKWQVAAQQAFPHYYERFKTDGVEHNLYIGKSIVPNLEFELTHLYNLRLYQLQVLCQMEAEHQLLKPLLPYPLEVTSLVLVFDAPIDIRFRMDEKHFDVDGTYNARYEMVKKRIDKALVKGTTERITSAGKLTVVYSNKDEELEYMGYTRFLQMKGMLHQDVELLEVEDLQGISGLKALRVNILQTANPSPGKLYSYTELVNETKPVSA